MRRLGLIALVGISLLIPACSAQTNEEPQRKFRDYKPPMVKDKATGRLRPSTFP